MPPTTAVPIAIHFTAPAEAAITSGRAPTPKASISSELVVARSCAIFTAAGARAIRKSRNALANSMIRVSGGQELHKEIDIIVQPARQRCDGRPDEPSGTTSSTPIGIVQLAFAGGSQSARRP
jgi:hypothetical protein